jgi:hypothetical protein
MTSIICRPLGNLDLGLLKTEFRPNELGLSDGRQEMRLKLGDRDAFDPIVSWAAV